jgi:hypothetical protein
LTIVILLLVPTPPPIWAVLLAMVLPLRVALPATNATPPPVSAVLLMTMKEAGFEEDAEGFWVKGGQRPDIDIWAGVPLFPRDVSPED